MESKKNIILMYFQLKRNMSYFIKQALRSTDDVYNI